ncbi:MAG: glycosyltransferase family 2 protein [Phycisphaeraceae bacterium]|nr:glycosyltransferase family 2 protein [Phycisphaeraceae bacterium]
MRLGVIIPAYNEAPLLPRAIERLDAMPPPAAESGEPIQRVIILVDDGSNDGTAELVRALGQRADIEARLHQRNRGKGAAIRTGLDVALELGVDIALIHDADLEYDPADHAAALAPILAGQADAVIGSRFIGQSHRVLYYWHSLANRVITLCSNLLTNLNLTDIECCTKAFSRPVLERLRLRENRFGVEPELIARLAKMRLAQPGGRPRRLRIFEVGVRYAGRTYAEGKKIDWRDGVRALWCIFRYNLFARRSANSKRRA